MLKKWLILSSILLLCSVKLFAGTTGKISGRVTDSETGEPLPGINIIIENKAQGAASDIDGNFIINNIDPGSYTIVASGVGFQRTRIIDVQVVADFTTRLDFEMSAQSIEVETVVVRAERQMVRKDLTSSHTSINSEEIENLPVESISQILALQAGITQGVGGELHIRGGRSNEIAYTVNGVSINNPYNNSQSVSIATNAVQELSVVSGTFNAEYGNALSGIVNTVTKEGGSSYSGTLSFYTGDYVSSNDNIFFNIDDIDPFNNYVAEGTLSGPVPFLGNKLSVFLSGRYSKSKGYLYGIRQHTIYDSVFKDPFNPNNINISATGDNAIVAMNPSEGLSTTAKLTYRPMSTLKINFDFIYSKGEGRGYSHSYKYNPDAVATGFSEGILNILEIRHALSNSTFYTLRGTYTFDDSKGYLFPLVDSQGNAVDFYAGMSLDGLFPDNRYQPQTKSRTLPAPIAFVPGGTGSTPSHSYQRTTSWGFKFDMTSQLNNNHELKFGGRFRTYDMKSHYFEIIRDSLTTPPRIPIISTNQNNFWEQKPFELSAYAQDKMEFDKLILNIGLRYDFFSPKAQYSTNTFYPTPNAPGIPSTIDKNALLADADPKHQFSPRIGVSFPITDRGIIHFSYGHFLQLPNLVNLYTNSEFEYSLGSPTYGNADLKAQKTIAYELGLQQQLFEDLAFNITGYYKDVRDLLARQQIRISGNQTYFKYVNKDYANIKGIVFSLTKRRLPGDLLRVTLDYTFQTAEGNEVNADAFFLDLSSGRQSEKIPVFLNWDKTHQVNTTVSVGETRDWNITIVGKVGTGLPYTPEIFDKQVFLEVNSGRRPILASVDLLAEKTLKLYGLDITAFVKVFNLFDTLNENIVYASTGRSNYTLDETRGPATETNRLAEIYPEIKTAGEFYSRPNYYSAPRQVRLGLTIDF